MSKENGAEYITTDIAKLNNGSNAVLRKLGFKIEREDSLSAILTGVKSSEGKDDKFY